MTALLEKMEQEAKELSREERERLVVDLMADLEAVPLSEIDLAWIEEAEKRYEAWRAGRTTGIPAEQVFGGIRKALSL